MASTFRKMHQLGTDAIYILDQKQALKCVKIVQESDYTLADHRHLSITL